MTASATTRLTLVMLSTVTIVGACGDAQTNGDRTAAAANDSTRVEAVSLLGDSLRPRSIPAETRARLEGNLAAARAAYERTPNDADSIIWLGRRLAYLERYQDAIRTFSEGIEKHPDDPRMYRHRGHRYITVRRFDDATADFQKAATLSKGMPDSLEEDGAPNAKNVPRSTAQGNIWYHLALVHYLSARYDSSLAAWREAARIATNDDSRVSVADWHYMTLRRLGRDAEAKRVLEPIRPEMDVIENSAYHKRLLMYKGLLAPDSLLAPGNTDALQYVTQGYGVANWYLANGDSARAQQIFDQVLDTGYWAAFGYIAAEADVARQRGR